MSNLGKKIAFLFIIAGIGLLLPALAGAAIKTTPAGLTLEQAKELALTRGTAYLLLELGEEQAEKTLNMIRRQYGLGAVGIADGTALKQQINELETIIEEKQEKIKLLKEDIDRWKGEQEKQAEQAEETLPAVDLQGQIDRAYAEIAEHDGVISDLRPALAQMIPRYYQIKSLEDMARPSLDPAVAGVEAISDALLTQPAIINYQVENAYLSLLALEKQREFLDIRGAFLEKMQRREQVLYRLGMSTTLKLTEMETTVRGVKEAGQKLQAGKDDLKRSFMNLLGLPLDFTFVLQPVELPADALDAEQTNSPDLSQSVRYRRAENNLQKKKEDLGDTSKGDSNKYRLAELDLQKAEIELANTLNDLQANYENSMDALALAGEARESAGRNLEHARTIMAQTELKYTVGAVALVEREQQQLALQEAELQYYLAGNEFYLAGRAYLLAREGIELGFHPQA